jgi:hypothetical protein
VAEGRLGGPDFASPAGFHLNQGIGERLMKILCSITCVLALSVPAVAAAADDNYGCDAINFGEEVLQKMPNAKKLCRGIKSKGDGVYVHYIAEVESAKPDAIKVKFLDKDNKAVSRVTFQPTDDQSVMIDNKSHKYSSLEKGQKLDFWIEHKRWGLYSNPDGKLMQIVSVEQL